MINTIRKDKYTTESEIKHKAASIGVYAGEEKYLTKPPEPKWYKETVLKIRELLQFEENWDGYGSLKPDNNLYSRSLPFIREILEHESKAPSVIPIADGSVQYEWHTEKYDLEIRCAYNAASIFFYDVEEDKEEEFYYTDNPARAKQLIKLVTLNNSDTTTSLVG